MHMELAAIWQGLSLFLYAAESVLVSAKAGRLGRMQYCIATKLRALS